MTTRWPPTLTSHSKEAAKERKNNTMQSQSRKEEILLERKGGLIGKLRPGRVRKSMNTLTCSLEWSDKDWGGWVNRASSRNDSPSRVSSV